MDILITIVVTVIVAIVFFKMPDDDADWGVDADGPPQPVADEASEPAVAADDAEATDAEATDAEATDAEATDAEATDADAPPRAAGA